MFRLRNKKNNFLVRTLIIYYIFYIVNFKAGKMIISNEQKMLLVSTRQNFLFLKREHSGSVAQWLSGRVLDSRPKAAGSSLTGVTVLCPYWFKPGSPVPTITVILLMGR